MDEQLPPAFSDALTVRESCPDLSSLRHTAGSAQRSRRSHRHLHRPALGGHPHRRPWRSLRVAEEVLHGQLQEHQEAGGDHQVSGLLPALLLAARHHNDPSLQSRGIPDS